MKVNKKYSFLAVILSFIIVGISFDSFAKKKKGKKFLFSVMLDAHYTNLIKENSYLYVFEDGSFYLNTNTGDFGLCLQTGAGEFKGKIDSKEISKFIKNLDGIGSSCTKKLGCTSSGHYKSKTPTWTVNDLRKGGQKKYTFTKATLPGLISDIMKKVKTLKESPINSLSLKHNKKQRKLLFTYEGESSLSIQLTEEDFLLKTESGKIIPSSDFIMFEGDSKADLKNGKTIEISYQLKSKNKSKDKITHIIHTTVPGAHHLDQEKRLYFNCVKF